MKLIGDVPYLDPLRHVAKGIKREKLATTDETLVATRGSCYNGVVTNPRFPGGILIYDGAPNFGLWYDFRQETPFMKKCEDFHAGCLEEIEEGERIGFTGAWLSEHHFVDCGCEARS